MGTTRKLMFRLAGFTSILVAIMALSSFVGLALDLNGAQEMFAQSISQTQIIYTMSVKTATNFMLAYLVVCTIANVYFAYSYYSFSQLNYPEFLLSKKVVTKTIILNMFVSVFLVPLVFALIAVWLKESKYESAESVLYLEQKRKERYLHQLMAADSRFAIMSVEISALKERFKKLEISEIDYKKELNKILERVIKNHS